MFTRPPASKLIERAVLRLLTEHLSRFDFLPDHQSAYRANYSTETALLSLTNDLLSSADAGNGCALLFLDLSAAFDTIDHRMLLDRLSYCFGLPPSALKWFEFYLSGRTQSIQVESFSSAVVLVLFRVAQGSVLGGTLFNMHVTPLAIATSTDGVVVRQYSDDSRACIEFTIRPDFSSQLQCCLTLAAWAVPTSAWLTLNRVFLNIDKCDLLLTSTARQAPLVGPVPLQIGSSVIKSSTEAKNLGVTFDSHLTMSTHFRLTFKIALFHLSRINKIRRYHDPQTAKCVVNALVLPRLDYCNSLFVGLHGDLLKRLQHVQNSAARTVPNLPRREPVRQHLKSLG